MLIDVKLILNSIHEYDGFNQNSDRVFIYRADKCDD